MFDVDFSSNHRKGNKIMKIKTMALSAVALCMMGGAVLAAGENTSALDDQAKMSAFYTDSSMKTMKADDEFVAAWKALTEEDRMAMTKACADEVANANPTNTHPEFCSNTKRLGGNQ